MNYEKSTEILEKVKSVNKILLSCHHHPDSDTVGSATVLATVFKDMGKEVKVICPDEMPDFLKYINGASKIEEVKFEDFNFNDWDLFIVCDTSDWKRLFVSENFSPPSIPVVVIDNHSSNKGFGEISLLDYETSSVCEMVYFILNDWEVALTSSFATSLLSGMVGDTGSFQYEVFKRTFDVADKLVNLGADVRGINYNLFGNLEISLIKFWGVVIQKLTLDPAGFCYVAVPYDEYKEYLHLFGTRETAATQIIARVKNTKFGFILTEEQEGSISISFRSRTGVDVSRIAVALGGGGHPAASGAWIRGKTFDEALRWVLEECRKT